MLNTDQIAQPANGEGASPEIAEFAGTIKAGGVPVNVIVNVVLIDVRTDDERVIALQKAFGKFIADPIGLFRCDLAWFEGLRT